MSTFAEIEKRTPPSNVVVPPHAFADTWDEKPTEEVCIGLRLVPDTDLEDARIEAVRRADELVPKPERSSERAQVWAASFHDALVRWIVARGTCDPNNVAKAWKGWATAPEDMVRVVLTDHGVQLIFDAWERMRLGLNIGIQPATDEDLQTLPALLQRLPALEATRRLDGLRIRRLLRFCLEQLEEMPVPLAQPTSPT